MRFRTLLPKADWETLSPDIQRRFTKRLQNGAMALFKGSLSVGRMNGFGRILSQALRIVGAP